MRRPLTLAAVFLALAPASASAASFVPGLGSPYPVGVAPFGVVPTDFNGDGATDVAVVNGTSSTLSVYLRQGSGFVQETGSQFPLNGPNFAASADFNADGRPDLAVANYAGDYVTHPAAHADGVRRWKGRSIPADGPGAIATGDFNADGRPDLAVTHYDTGGVTVPGAPAHQRLPADGRLHPHRCQPAPDRRGRLQRRRPARPRRRELSARQRDDPVAEPGVAGLHARRHRPARRCAAVRRGCGATSTRTAGPTWRPPTLGSDSVTVYHRNASGSGFAGPTTIQVGDGPTCLTCSRFRRRRRERHRGREQRRQHDHRAPRRRHARSADLGRRRPPPARGRELRRRCPSGSGHGAQRRVAARNPAQHHPDPAAASAADADSHADADAPSAGWRQDRQRHPGLRHRARQGTGQQPLRHAAGGRSDPGRIARRHPRRPRDARDRRRAARRTSSTACSGSARPVASGR